MGTISKQFQQEETNLKKQINYIRESLKKYPDGILEVSHTKKHVQYYYRESNQAGTRQKRKYIKKRDVAFAGSLAQRDYEKKLLSELETRLQAIRTARNAYEKTCPEEVSLKFTADRQRLIQPLILCKEEYMRKWQEKEYERKPFQENTPEIYTIRGERVRSKSEKIIADTLYRAGVPYRYEYPLELENYGLVYPDFLVLNPDTRKEYYWEHFGMLDDEQYARNAIQKINAYERNDILLGQELILTLESKTMPITNRMIDNIISRFLICSM